MSSLSIPLLLSRRMLMPSICHANTPLTPNRHKSTRTAEREKGQMFRQERAAKRKEAAERRQKEKKKAEEQKMQERVTQRQKYLVKLEANKEKKKRGPR